MRTFRRAGSGIIRTMRVLDEPAKLIADEPTDIEKGTPAEENELVERIRDNDGAEPPEFEE